MPVVAVGTSEDVTTCEQCGRTDLRRTVHLKYLDSEGNDQGEAYFGTQCAASAVGGTAKEWGLKAAEADIKRASAVESSRRFLDWFDGEGKAAFEARGRECTQEMFFNRQANKYIWKNHARDFPVPTMALSPEQESEKRRVTLESVAYHATVVETAGISALLKSS